MIAECSVVDWIFLGRLRLYVLVIFYRQGKTFHKMSASPVFRLWKLHVEWTKWSSVHWKLRIIWYCLRLENVWNFTNDKPVTLHWDKLLDYCTLVDVGCLIIESLEARTNIRLHIPFYNYYITQQTFQMSH